MEINKIMSLHDELRSNHDSGLSQLKSFYTTFLCDKHIQVKLSNLSRAAKFWIHYFGYVKIAKEFIRGTRVGQ